MNAVRASKTANPVFKKRIGSSGSLLVRQKYRLVPFGEMVANHKNKVVAIRNGKWTKKVETSVMERVADLPVSQGMAVGLSGSRLLLTDITTLDELLDAILKSRPIESFMHFLKDLCVPKWPAVLELCKAVKISGSKNRGTIRCKNGKFLSIGSNFPQSTLFLMWRLDTWLNICHPKRGSPCSSSFLRTRLFRIHFQTRCKLSSASCACAKVLSLKSELQSFSVGSTEAFKKNDTLNRGSTKDFLNQLAHLLPFEFVETRSDTWQTNFANVMLFDVRSHSFQGRVQSSVSWFLIELLFCDEMVDVSFGFSQPLGPKRVRDEIPPSWISKRVVTVKLFCSTGRHFEVSGHTVAKGILGVEEISNGFTVDADCFILLSSRCIRRERINVMLVRSVTTARRVHLMGGGVVGSEMFFKREWMVVYFCYCIYGPWNARESISMSNRLSRTMSNIVIKRCWFF